MPSFFQIALFALEMQSDPSPCSIFQNEIFSDRIACYLTRLKQNIANCTTDPRVEFFHLSNRFYVTSKFNAKISTTLKLQNLGCGMWHWNHCPFSASTKNMNNTWPWLLDTWTWLVNWWAFVSLYSATFFIVCLYLSQKICRLSRCSTVERIHSATFSTSCKRFAPFCQIDLNNFVPLHFPTCCVFFCNHLAARLNLISSATFSICCNLCLQISIGNIPFCRNDPLRYLFHILYTFCIFLSNRLEKFCSTTFSNLLCFFCNFLASRLNLTSSATFSNCCNLFLQISIGYIPFCRTDQLRYLFHILYMFCIYYID